VAPPFRSVEFTSTHAQNFGCGERLLVLPPKRTKLPLMDATVLRLASDKVVVAHLGEEGTGAGGDRAEGEKEAEEKEGEENADGDGAAGGAPAAGAAEGAAEAAAAEEEEEVQPPTRYVLTLHDGSGDEKVRERRSNCASAE
jgi:hypothetical protein